MTILLILAPYAAFAMLMLVSSATTSLFAAAAVCLVVIAHDMLRGRSIKVLGAGSAILFAALGAYLALTGNVWSSSAVKFAVDAGVLAITLASLAIGKPFTLQYAREMADAQTAKLPDFLTANYVITSAWTLALVLMMTANALLIYVPGLPLWTGLAVAIAARNTAIYFTRWYPEYRKAKSAAPAIASPGS
ncbi:MAG: hypothetical protein ACLQDM_30035 [Bradyrhizobium sp.]